MSSVNKVILIGNLGQDPEVRYMPSGGAVTNLRLATTDKRKDKQSGEVIERTEWHTLVCFNRTAEIAGEYLRKGSQIYVEGSLRTRKWQDKEGRDRYSTEVVVDDLQMLGKRDSAANQASSSTPSAAAASAASRSASRQPAPAGEFDDDIPF